MLVFNQKRSIEFKMKSVLITGILGHIGFATALKLTNKFKVYGTYNKSINKKRFQILKKNGVIFIRNNFSNEKKTFKILNKFKIKTCIYCAGISHEIYAKKRTHDTIQSNISSLLNVLKYSIKKKFQCIYVSTGSVFQDIKSDRIKLSEDTIPTPKSIYSGSKRLGEILIECFREYFKINVCVLRVSWVYGPDIITKKIDVQRGPIPYLIYLLCVRKKKKIIFNSGGNFKASFTYIGDVTKTIQKMISSNIKYKNSIYQLSTNKNSSNYQLSKYLMQILPNVKIVFGKGKKPWSNDSVVRGPMESKKLYEDFGIKYKYDLKLGLKDFIKNLK